MNSLEFPEIPDDYLENHFPNGFSNRDEANALVAYSFRNGPIENLHAGKNSKLLSDKSLSRITNEEMKELMVYTCEKIEQLLKLKSSEPEKYKVLIKSINVFYCKEWEQ